MRIVGIRQIVKHSALRVSNNHSSKVRRNSNSTGGLFLKPVCELMGVCMHREFQIITITPMSLNSNIFIAGFQMLHLVMEILFKPLLNHHI